MKNDFVMPILVLSLICLVISGALAITNSVTEPIIVRDAAAREVAARLEMIPEADDFELITVEGLPDSIREVYKATNNVGYVITLLTSGYGGDMIIICGIDSNGTMIHNRALEQSETKGLGSKITETPFNSQFDDIERHQVDDIDAITGATLSSTAYIEAIKDAFTAYSILVNWEG